MEPRIVRELELERFGYRVSLIAPDYFAPFPDGSSLTLWGDLRRDSANIARFSKHDADAFVEFDRYFERIAPLLKQMLFVVPPNLSVRDLPRWLALAGKFRRWTGGDIAELVRLFTISAADLLDEWFEDERVKGALATQAVIGAWSGPMSPGSAYVLVHHWVGEVDGHADAWGRVHGGMGGVTAALAASAEAAGAEIVSDRSVRRVVVSNGRAVGVELEDGSIVRAGRFISNAHPVTTYLDLVGVEHLSGEVVRAIRRYRSRSGSVKVNVALGELPRFRRGTRRATSTAGSWRSRPRSSTSSGHGTTRSTAGPRSTRTSRRCSPPPTTPTSLQRASTSCSPSRSSGPTS